jgi:hypothetical protein
MCVSQIIHQVIIHLHWLTEKIGQPLITFGLKIEKTPIYVSTKPNSIPPCVHPVLLVTLGFVGNPRQLGLPGGIWLVIRPVESFWGFGDHPKVYHE